MPINVTCPGCDYHFLVGDEFAGQPGRCPECGNVINVPDPHAEQADPEIHHEPHPEPHPFQTPHVDEPLEEFPLRSYRRQDDRYESGLREDFDDRPRDRTLAPREPAFDPLARAANWQRVHKGLGYIQIAVVLYFLSQLLQTGFFLVHGVENNNPNAMPDSGEIAVGLGGLVFILFAAAFWMLGRFAMIKSPYVPSRGWARVSFYMVLGVLGSIAGFCCLFTGGLMIAAGGPNPGALGLIMLSLLALILAMVLVAGAELCGLMSLAKVGDGLHAASAATWARMSALLLVLLIGAVTVGGCGFLIWATGQQQKKQAQGGNRAANPNPGGVQQKGNAPIVKGNGPNNPPAAGNPPPAQQPPLFDDNGADPKAQFIFQTVLVGLILLYLVQYSISLQKGRRAIREEIHTLTGGKDGHDDHHRERHY